MTYASLEQRMVHTYLDTFAPFVSSRGFDAGSQEAFYRFMKRLYQMLAERPQLLVSEIHADDVYTQRFNKTADGKPKLRDFMRKMLKELESLTAVMLGIGTAGRLDGAKLVFAGKIGKKHRLVLEQLGLAISKETGGLTLQHADGAKLFAAWKWLAGRGDALAFSRCLFDKDHPYASAIYARLLGDERAFRRLETYLREHGYTAFANHDGLVCLDYINLRGEKLTPKFGFQYGIRHTGISASYDPLVRDPAVLGLRIPWMKEMLSGFATLPPAVGAFLIQRTRKCSGCRYCVQTDKTGQRPLAKIAVAHDGKTLQLCPYFPGYSYNWTRLNDELVNNLIALLAWMDQAYAPSARSA